MRKISKIVIIALTAICLSSCSKSKQESQWKTFFGFSANDIIGTYSPNEEEWDALLTEEIEKSFAVRNTTANIESTSENSVTVTLYGIPSKLEHTFSCTIQQNDYMFNSGNLSVQVYKNNEGRIRLHGYVKYKIGSQYDEALGNPANGYMIDTFEYYYFDIIRKTTN